MEREYNTLLTVSLVPITRGVKRFDDDAVGADLRVRPDAEVDVSGQTHRSAPTVSSLVAKRRNNVRQPVGESQSVNWDEVNLKFKI